MGIPVDFPERNFIFTHPTGGDLPAMLTHQEGVSSCVVSCWELSPEELEQVMKTGKVWLCTWGNGTPPVWVGGESPIEHPGSGDGEATEPIG